MSVVPGGGWFGYLPRAQPLGVVAVSFLKGREAFGKGIKIRARHGGKTMAGAGFWRVRVSWRRGGGCPHKRPSVRITDNHVSAVMFRPFFAVALPRRMKRAGTENTAFAPQVAQPQRLKPTSWSLAGLAPGLRRTATGMQKAEEWGGKAARSQIANVVSR